MPTAIGKNLETATTTLKSVLTPSKNDSKPASSSGSPFVQPVRPERVLEFTPESLSPVSRTITKMGFTPDKFLIDIVDAAKRATGRLVESVVYEHTESDSARIGVRAVVEAGRKFGEMGLKNLIQSEKTTRAHVNNALSRMIENTVASAAVDPFHHPSPIRSLYGSANFGVRYLLRHGMKFTGLINKEALGHKNLAEDVFARTAGRLIWVPTSNPLVKWTCSFFEQCAINFDIHSFRIADKLLGKMGVSNVEATEKDKSVAIS